MMLAIASLEIGNRDTISALAQQYSGLDAAAVTLGYSSVEVLQNAIGEYCAA